MGLFDTLNNNDDLEERMDDLDLEEWQKELVREGKYDPENFDEEPEEEDDYYELFMGELRAMKKEMA